MRERSMFARARILLMIAASVLATPLAAQAPAPTTSAFDGKYVGTATLTTPGRKGTSMGLNCGTITSVDMTITGGQVVIRETMFNGGMPAYRGSVNAAGEVSASRPPNGAVSGTVHDKVFTGQRLKGRCSFSVQMQQAPAAAAFDRK
jgi:hypothetical protein